MKLSIGTWRFFLAFLVAISHLYIDMIHGPAAYAVWAFFVLSGYLMTFVLSTKYDLHAKGLTAYAFNRFVRIYPGYIVAFLLGLATIWGLQSKGFEPTRFNPQFMFPQGWAEWLTNLTMFAFGPHRGLPVPVASPLFIEIAAYALMPFFAKDKATAWLGFIVAFFANYQYGFDITTFGTRYTAFATCLLPFAAGALICHYRIKLRALAFPLISVAVWCLHAVYWLYDPAWPWTYGLWLSVPLSSWVVLSLSGIKGGATDRWLGDLSYPVYLLHTVVGSWFAFQYGYSHSLAFFLVAFSATILCSYLMVILVDLPLQKIKITPKKTTPIEPTEKVAMKELPVGQVAVKPPI